MTFIKDVPPRNDVIIHLSNYSARSAEIFRRANDFTGVDIHRQRKLLRKEVRQYQPQFSSGDQARLIKKVCAALSVHKSYLLEMLKVA